MKKILVIEDDPNIRENIVELLEDEGYHVFTAANGRDGIAVALERKPTLIVSDVLMPGIDGFGVLKAVRSEPSLATTPFIFLTAKVDKPDFRAGMELGADDYLTKPFTHDELLQAISSRLSKQTLYNDEAEKKISDLRKNISYALPHEFRTPLSGIIAPAKMMLDSLDVLSKEDLRDFLRIIYDSGERLHRLIQNFLLYSQLEMDVNDAAQIAVMRKGSTLGANTICSKAASDRAVLHKRTQDLHLTIGDGAVAMAKDHLEKVCSELVDNALKFSKPGQPVAVSGECIDQKFYRLRITDNGKGIQPEEIEKIEAFVQFKRKVYEQQGTGLGLAIVKRLIAMHGGTLEFKSVPGAGTSVTAMLPLYREPS
jgi:two-component system, sensor histidine kinase and response regulator